MYTVIAGNTNLSTFATSVQTQHEQIRSLERAAYASAPTVKPTGLIWDRTDEGTLGEALMRWNGAAWTVLMDPEATQLNNLGTVALGADQPCGGFKLTGLGAGSASGHSVRYEQVVLVSGANALTGNLSAGTNKITNLGTPTSAADAVTKAYVDAAGALYFQTNRDFAANSKPVTLESDGATTAMTDLGFVPRRIVLRFKGGIFTTDGNNTLQGSGSSADAQVAFDRWETDATAGYTEPASQTATFVVNSTTITVTVTWKTSGTLGVAIKLTAGGSLRMKVGKDSSTPNTPGVVQLLAYRAQA